MRIGTKIVLTLATLLCSLHTIGAQEREIALGVQGGYNVALGGYSAVSLEGDFGVMDNVDVRGGVQWATYGRRAVELRPSYTFLSTSWGALHLRTLLHSTFQASSRTFAAGVGAGLSNRSLFCTLGYYYRTLGVGGEYINEPVNFFYELGFHFLPDAERVDLQLVFTNHELFELERQYQPTWIVRGEWAVSDALGVSLAVNYKSAGMFNMSSDFYQLNFKAGVCYRW
jgi:hypothetical protein